MATDDNRLSPRRQPCYIPSVLSQNLQIIISCEHATSAIPSLEKAWFAPPVKVLKSHRGWDIGALDVALQLSKKLKAPLYKGEHSRLLMDLNRTNEHKSAFSEFSRKLPVSEKQRILKLYHGPYWQELREAMHTALRKSDMVLHLGIHSFTPIFQGYERTTDFGLLFDPARPLELELCGKWRNEFRELAPKRTAHLNRPYRGTGDGLITEFRKEFSAKKYIGVEVEINQKHLKRGAGSWAQLLENSLRTALDSGS